MEITRINPRQPEPVLIAHIARAVRDGLPFVFPTDTVYGLGLPVVAGGSPQALFALKGRDGDKAIPWLVAGASALDEYAEDVPGFAFDLAQQHWPGALTLVVRASAAVPGAFRAPDGSVALRAPAHPIARALIEALGTPVATTSANRQGYPPATSLAALDPELAARLAYAVDGGPTPGVAPSTIVSCLGEKPLILREGALPPEHLLH
ncbi:MAG: threonylcarbamoyl-AMP synthase [Coriobacteriales bacterium]|jgi:L-threonylcarbamoyladenylate synthase|nr:threonylcarbamoyl-AMP synthase [Coriobacteriales bacterium]